MTDEGLDLSRRKMLTGLGAVGAASIGTGYGALAFLSDREQFANDEFVAGTLDLKVGWETHYFDSAEQVDGLLYPVLLASETDTVPDGYVGLPDPASPVLYVHVDDVSTIQSNTLDARFPEGGLGDDPPCTALGDTSTDLPGPLVDLGDVKPGDFGEVTFSLAVCDNPGFVWLTGRLVDEAENGTTGSEALVDGPGVELTDEIRTAVWYDDCDNVFEDDERVVFRGSLREFLTASSLGDGIPLDADAETDGVDCFEPTVARCLGFAWWLPADAGNAIQTDSVTFDLGFYTEQCRHNDVSPPHTQPSGSPGPAISFLALCGDGATNGLDRDDVRLSVLDSDGDGPTRVQWELLDGVDASISTAVVKAGQCLTNVEYPGGTTGPETVTGCQGDPADADQCPSGPAPDGEHTLVKLEYEGDTDSFVKSTVNGTCNGNK